MAVQTPSFYSFILSIEERSLFHILVLFPDSLLLSFSTSYSRPVHFYGKETTPIEDWQRVSSARQNHSDTLIRQTLNGTTVLNAGRRQSFCVYQGSGTYTHNEVSEPLV